MAGTVGYIIFYVTFYVAIGLLGYFAGSELGMESYVLEPPTLDVPPLFEPTELGDTAGADIFEWILDFLAWLGYIVVFIIAAIGFGIELLIYLLSFSGLSAFGLPFIWSVSLSVILTTTLIFVLVKTWKGG